MQRTYWNNISENQTNTPRVTKVIKESMKGRSVKLRRTRRCILTVTQQDLETLLNNLGSRRSIRTGLVPLERAGKALQSVKFLAIERSIERNKTCSKSSERVPCRQVKSSKWDHRTLRYVFDIKKLSDLDHFQDKVTAQERSIFL